MKLRVCHLITQLELGGAQRNTLYTVGHLDARRFEPLLICGKKGILDEEARAGTWPTYFVPSLVRPVNPFCDLLAAAALYRLLRRLKPHVVHTHSSKAGILGRAAAYLAGVPVIIHTFHGFGFTPAQPAWLRALFIRIEKFCARLSTHLIYVSEDNRTEAESLGLAPAKKGSLIRSGILLAPAGPSSIRQELGISEDAWLMISVGNFKPQKNPEDLIQTAGAVLAAHPKIHFLLIGDGKLRKGLERKVRSQRLAANIHFLGWRQDVAALLGASNGFLLTSLWEGLPRSIVEAFAARLPVVAYGVNGVRDLVKDDQNGFLIPPGNTGLAAEKILWLCAHPHEARQMGERGRQRVAVEFDIDLMVRQQETLYEKLYEAVPLKEFYEPLWTARPR